MRIAITSDSACDLPKELQEQINLIKIPYKVILGENEHLDGINVTQDDIYEFVKQSKNLPKTACINAQEYEDFFNSVLKDYDAVIHFNLSFELSSSGNNAVIASNSIGNDKVKVIDSASLSSGIALLVLSCFDKIQEGKDLHTIVKEIEEEKEKVQASFVINTLSFLHKGGRCSSLELLGANLLAIKPRISLKNGKMQVTKKYIGKINQVAIKYADDIIKECPPNKKRVFVTYSSPVVPAKDEIKKKLQELGFEEVYECQASSTICSHCGPETIGVLYMAE